MTTPLATGYIFSALLILVGAHPIALAKGAGGPSREVAAVMKAGTHNGVNDPQTPGCKLTAGPTKLVTQIIDAVTMRLDDGTELRLIGLHVAGPGQIQALGETTDMLVGESSTIKLLSRIALGKAIELKFDTRRSDRYGRILAHGFIKQGATRLWLQAELVRRGRALVSSSQGNHACALQLRAIEQQARQSATGYWGENIFRIRKAWKAGDVLKYRQSFQIVAGRVRRVSRVKSRIYLNFGANWKKDFTVVIERRVQQAMKWNAEDYDKLENKQVRVRGWIDEKNGPIIRLLYPEDLEIISNRQ